MPGPCGGSGQLGACPRPGLFRQVPFMALPFPLSLPWSPRKGLQERKHLGWQCPLAGLCHAGLGPSGRAGLACSSPRPCTQPEQQPAALRGPCHCASPAALPAGGGRCPLRERPWVFNPSDSALGALQAKSLSPWRAELRLQELAPGWGQPGVGRGCGRGEVSAQLEPAGSNTMQCVGFCFREVCECSWGMMMMVMELGAGTSLLTL